MHPDSRPGSRPQSTAWISLLAIITLNLWFGGLADAIPSSPEPYDAWQPDGTRITLRLHGDEWFHLEKDPKGFTVIRERGWYVYARQDPASGRLVSTGLRVGHDNPAASGLRPGESPSAAARSERARALGIPDRNPFSAPGDGESASGPSASSHASGSIKNLVVMIKWSDHTGRGVPSEADVDVLMNHAGPHALAPTGSVRDVYLENSYGALSIDSTVAAWVTSDNTESYYANGNSGLTTRTHDAIRDALAKVDQFINFADFDEDGDGYIDSITFLHSGYAAEFGGSDSYGTHYTNRMWSHRWSLYTGNFISAEGVRVNDYHISPAVWGTSGTNIGRIGVIAHETGHFLGLPDLYDTDSSPGQGIGSFGLMANSWGFDGSQYYPPHMCPWSKIQMGWLSPTQITGAGSFTINQAESSAEAYRIDLGYPSGEYLLIENRQPAGFDGAMPQGGVVIYHIDEAAGYNTEGYPSGGSWTGSHYKIAVLQADGAYDLERGLDRGDSLDPWHAAGENELTVSLDPNTGPYPNTDAYQGNVFQQTNNRIYNISASGASMTFDFEVISAPSNPPAAPSSLVATAVSYEQIDLSWSDNSSDEDVFKIERSVGDESNYAEVAVAGADSVSYSDTGLAPNTTYFYRVRAGNVAGDSAYSNSASDLTDPPPPPPNAPTNLVASAASDVAIDLSWGHASNDEDDFVVRRSPDGVSSWVDVATLAANTTSYQDTGLSANTTYHYQVFSRSTWGESGSNLDSATTDSPPASEDTVADLDIYVSGTVTPAENGYLETEFADGSEEIITETESGGRPSRRRSFLEHQWRFPNVRGGLAITLFANAWAPANNEGDNFEVQVSTDGGTNWELAFTIVQGSAPNTVYSWPLPSGDPGTFYVRVVDTDDTQGARELDSVHFDQLYFRTDLDPNDTPPNPPTNLVATANSASEVGLTWDDNSGNERGFRILRSENGGSFAEIAVSPIDSTSFLDTTVVPNTSYSYKIEAYTLSFAAESNVADVTTPDGIALSGTGSKKKGKSVGNLTWSGGSSQGTVDVWRSIDGGTWERITTVSNTAGSQSLVDETGVRAGTLEYQVCSPTTNPQGRSDATVQSNVILIAF